MKAVALALAAFLPQFSEHSVVLMSDNALVVAYLQHQGSTVPRTVCLMASEITRWTEQHSAYLSARYIPRRKNILADQLSCPDQVLPMEELIYLGGICGETREVVAESLGSECARGCGRYRIFKINFWVYKAPPNSFQLYFLLNGSSKWEKTVVGSVNVRGKLFKNAAS